MSNRRQQSFGGVAALFGEDEKNDANHSFEAAGQIQQFAKPGGRSAPSFGGVASMFGEDDGNDNSFMQESESKPDSRPESGPDSRPESGPDSRPESGPDSRPESGPDSRPDSRPERGPDSRPEVTATTSAPPKSKQSRQASFGGVAALFGDDDGGLSNANPAVIDKEATKPKAHKQKSSFGGVASLFSPAEEPAPISHISQPPPPQQHTQPQPQPTKPQQNTAQKTRQQSFGGVATLFSSMDENDDPKPGTAPTNNISSMFASVAPTPNKNQNQSQNPSMGQYADYNFNSQTKSGKPPAPPTKKQTKQKKSKRDPSISGVFSLFGDDQVEDSASPTQVKVRQEQTQKTIEDLDNQKKEFSENANILNQKIELAESKTKELEDLKIKIKNEINDLRESKILLIRRTEMEMRHMRQLMSDPDAAFEY